jgi:hypothetical protein
MRRSIAIAGTALTLAATGAGAVAATPTDETAIDVADEPQLVPMQEISLPIIDGDRLEGSLHVTIVIAANDLAAADRVAAALPRLRSASLAATLEFSSLYASPMRAVNAEMLSRDLTQALQQEEPGITRALIVNVATRPV